MQLGYVHIRAAGPNAGHELDMNCARLPSRAHLSRRSEAGQGMVEFALVITFVFLLFVGIVQMILLMYAYTTLADAAKEGVRYAIVHGTQNTSCSGPSTSGICTTSDTSGRNVKNAVLNFGANSSTNALAGISFQNITSSEITVTWPDSCSNPGCTVRVTVSHSYTPLFGFAWPSITLNAAAQGSIMN